MDLTLDNLLKFTVKQDASDLFIKANNPPLLRIYGDMVPMNLPALTSAQTRELSFSNLTDEQAAGFDEEWELDYSYELEGVARFRCNVCKQMGHVGSFYRVIPFGVKTMEELNLPEMAKRSADRPRGMVLVTGPTGSGKSTSLAGMIRYVNETRAEHIMTVEDPVEFIHEDVKCLINQREIGSDTQSFQNALKFVLRQDPDVILIGEMRDLETIHLAITAAETGHLVFATLHTTDAVQTIDRVIDVFPTHQQQQVRMQLSVNLVGVMSQVLVKRKDGKGRVPAFETMEATPAVRNLIREAKTHQIASIIQTGSRRGMWTLTQHLADLVIRGLADPADAR
ncbi:MAG TPA: type IV pilus twitching motility protein PilT, partial [Armatimonadota bacterium]|nr:type IV pilus twitching motility protein PilT [Armatimonadota bacterium]